MSSKHEMSSEGWGPYLTTTDGMADYGLGPVVAEVGSYTTKVGYAGEDHPRSVFRTDVAALREGGGGDSGGGKKGGGGGGNKITKFKHGDWWHHPLERDGTDGRWEVVSPVDGTTGLIYDSPTVVPSSGQGTGGDGGEAGEAGGGGAAAASADGAAAGGDGGQGGAGGGGGGGAGGGGGNGECYTLLSHHLTHAFTSSLPTTSAEQPLVLIERPYTPPAIRQKYLEILFEDLNVPAAFLARDAVMACYAVGRSTGTVVDVGHSGTVVTPVYDGYVEHRGIVRSPVGGEMMDDMVLDVLDGLYRAKIAARKQRRDPNTDGPNCVMPLYQVKEREKRGGGVTGYSGRRTCVDMHTEARRYVARTAKEFGVAGGVGPFGYAAAAAAAATAGGGAAGGGGEGGAAASTTTIGADTTNKGAVRNQYVNAPRVPFDLPDGTIVEVPVTSKFDVAEVLFGRDAGSVRRREGATSDLRGRMDDLINASSSFGGGGAVLPGGEEQDAEEEDVVGTMSASGLRSVKTKQGRRRRRRQPYSQVVRRASPYLSNQMGELTSAAIPTMVCDAAFKCDRDQQAQLLGNVVLAGGGACLGPNDGSFPDRVRDEVEAIIHTHTPGWRVKVLSPDRRERSYCSWMGGSIMASIGLFHDFWITRKEYEEFGPAIVNRKCP